MKHLFILLLISFSAWAKNDTKITGTIQDSKGESVSFANVFLYQSSDSTFIKATSANENGDFMIEDLPFNTYYLKISSVGYEDYLSASFTLDKVQPVHHFENIVLQETANQLADVEIIAKKPFIEQKVDRTVINVENSILAAGSSILEVLEKAPGVTIDRQNNQIKLKNKSGVLVMIDNRKTYMSAEALTQYLNNMSSDQVESIDIITNPSSKYEAAGSSGIINIRLKKNKNYGTNGLFSLSAGQAFLPDAIGDLDRESVNFNINSRSAKWNLFGNTQLSRNGNFNDGKIERTINTTAYDQYFMHSYLGKRASIRLGADYFLNDKTTIGILGDFLISDGQGSTNGTSYIIAPETTTQITPNGRDTDQNKNFLTNFNLSHKFDNAGKNLSFDINYSQLQNQNISNYDYEYTLSPENISYRLISRLSQPTDIQIFTSQIDFTLPLKNKINLEMGAKTGNVTTDNNFVFEDQLDNSWVNNPQQSNHFKYREYINAAYFSGNYNLDKWAFQFGLRGEHTFSDGHSLTTDQRNKRNYFHLFPTVFINQNINDNNSINYSYSKRIDRPNYASLNPFTYYVDPLTYNRGNPFLNPQLTDSYSITYTLKQQYSLSLSYQDTKHLMNDILEQDVETGVAFQTKMNFARNQIFASNLSGYFAPVNWWTMNANLSVYYNLFKEDNINGFAMNKGKAAFNFNWANSFLLGKDWSAETSIWYSSPQTIGVIDVTKAQYAINAGLQKTLLNQNARLKLSISDPFLTSFSNAAINFGDMNIIVKNRWASRRLTLSFTYNFGNKNVKMTRKSTSADDLKGRAE